MLGATLNMCLGFALVNSYTAFDTPITWSYKGDWKPVCYALGILICV